MLIFWPGNGWYSSRAAWVAGVSNEPLANSSPQVRKSSSDYILLPDPAHPLAPFVHVQGARPAKGGGELFYVDVEEETASELDVLFPFLHPHATLIPAVYIVPPGK